MRKRVFAQVVLFVGIAGITLSLFQNCGTQMRTSPPAAAFATPEEIEDDLVYALKAAGPGARTICGSIESYTCETREYGADVADGQSMESMCLADGCVDVLVLAFNTKLQIENCVGDGCSRERIEEEYDYSMVRCMNKAVPAAGTLPLEGQGHDVESALAAAQARCFELAGMK